MVAVRPRSPTRSADARIARIAATQHGLFTRAQATRAGSTPSAIKTRLADGRWERRYPGVFRLAGSPATWRQRCMAACLYLDGPISHRAASVLSGLRSGRARVEVTVPRNRNRSRARDVAVHRTLLPLPPEDVTTIDAIPVTKPARTLLDLATIEPYEVLERCFDDALRRRLVSLPFLDRWLADPRRARHPGAPIMRRLIDDRATTGVTDTELEARTLRLIREAGLPLPMLQYRIFDGDRFVGRVDLAYPDARVAIEADGFVFHDTRTTFDRERARGNDLEALGWRVLRVTAAHLDDDPHAVIAWIERTLAAH